MRPRGPIIGQFHLRLHEHPHSWHWPTHARGRRSRPRSPRLWQQNYPQTAQKVQVELCELPGLALLDLLEDVHAALLVDAIHTKATPGTLYRLEPEDLAAFEADTNSAHGWGVGETLALGRSLEAGLAQCRFTLIGICW